MTIFYIYGLRCPIENKIKYVGVTNNPKRRYSSHFTNPVGQVRNWVRDLREQNLRPTMEILKEGNDFHRLREEEQWIIKLRPELNAYSQYIIDQINLLDKN